MVGDRDRAEPLRLRGLRAAPRPASRSRRSGRCACAGRRRAAAATAAGRAARGCRGRRGGGRRAACRPPRGRRRPRSRGAGRVAARSRSRRPASVIRCARPAASASGSRTSNTTPLSPSPVTSSYTGRRLTSGTAPAAWARRTRPGCGAAPSDAATRMSALASRAASSPSATNATRSRRSARSGVLDDGPRALWTTARQSRPVSRRRSARRNSRSADRSSSSTNAIVTGAPGGRTARGAASAPGATIR